MASCGALPTKGSSRSRQKFHGDERQSTASQPLGHRRRYPKTKNFFVVQALNNLFEESGMPEFCVQEAEPEFAIAPSGIKAAFDFVVHAHESQ